MTAFRIECRCPQCGAPAALEETDRVVACPFCRVRSVLTARDGFRYALPARRPAGRELFYVPYWRFKGFMLFARPEETEHTFIDMTRLGVGLGTLPHTLGVRAQAMKLKFATPETEGRFILPMGSFDAALEEFQSRLSRSRPAEALAAAHLGEAMGLVFAPVYAEEKLTDGVLDAAMGKVPEGWEAVAAGAGRLEAGVGFLPALCPACGWDLAGERDAQVLVCGNCSSAWAPAGGKLERVACECLKTAGAEDYYLPFWLTTCDIAGIDLATYADLVRVANLPKVLQPGFESRRFLFWTPAFKLRAGAFLRLSENLTLSQPQEVLAAGLPPGRHHPANLAAAESAGSLRVVLAGIMKPRKEMAQLLPRLALRIAGQRLAYLPFQGDRHDFVQPHTRVAINRNLLALSRSL